MAERWNMERSMLVDDLEGTMHRAYGELPNMTYILNAGGDINYRASWTDARTIRIALEQIIHERGVRREGTRITPYYMEWQPQRLNDRDLFMEGMLIGGGRRSVEEFIDAVAHNAGDAAANQLRDWWKSKQESEVEAPAD